MGWTKGKKRPPRTGKPIEAEPRVAVKITQGAMTISQTALMDARSRVSGAPIRIQPPKLPPGMDSPDNAVAMDSLAYDYASTTIAGQDGINYLYFVGYPYLAMLSQRAEYRAMSGRLASEMTREWIALRSTETAGDETKARMAELDTFLKELKLQAAVQELVIQDASFGRGNLFIEIAGQSNDKPLIQSPKTIAKGSLKKITTVEPMWTTPQAYNSTDPLAGGFYKASMWNVFGKSVHPTRMMTVVTRPMPDMLKPAYNFSGMSLYQMAEPYVNNWLRTRQSVSDLINTFSTTAIQTDLSQVLTGGSAAAMNARADLFSATKSNRGVMLLDKEREDLVQINTPLGGLHELQAQAQEQMCAVSFMPAIILTGISPGGLNASSDSEIMVWHEWIRGQQEAHYREPIQAVINVSMLSLFGEIDKDISFEFNPLKQMDAKDRSAMRTTDAQSDQLYVEMGVVSEEEVRETLARDPEGRFQGLDLNIVIEKPEPQEQDTGGAQDAEFNESDHPRAENGEFGSGGGKPLDHGELNIPGPTNNINAQLDKYKKEQSQQAKTQAKESAQQTKEHKALAKSLKAEFEAAIIAKHGDKFGEKELRNMLDQWAKWEPKKLINFVDKFKQETEKAE